MSERYYLQKHLNSGFYPASEEDNDYFKKIQPGKCILVESKQPRNPGYHRKFFSLLKFVFDNTEKFESITEILIHIKIKMGYYIERIQPDIGIVYIPKSISFDSMDQVKFKKFYSKAIDIIMQDIIVGIDKRILEDVINGVISYT